MAPVQSPFKAGHDVHLDVPGAGRRRIGLITPGYPPVVGGIESHVEMLAQGLVAEGMDVQVATLDATERLPANEIRDGVAIRRFPIGQRRGRFHLSASLGWWLWRHASRFDVLHAHGYHTPVAAQAAVAARRVGVPFVVSPHYHGTGHTAAMRLLHVPYGPVGTWMMRSATRIICDSNAERDLVVQHFGQGTRTRVIPIGVEVGRIRTARPFDLEHGSKVILSVGRLEAYKGAERVVRTMPFLPHQYRLVLVGDGPARGTLQTLIHDLGLDERVSLLGFVERSELDRWYRTAETYISLSRHEAFGITLLEAAAGGSMIVASGIPAHREVARYASAGQISFVEPDVDPELLAQAITEASKSGEGWSPGTDRIPTWSDMAHAIQVEYERSIGS